MSLYLLKKKADMKAKVYGKTGSFSIGPRQYGYGLLHRRNTAKLKTFKLLHDTGPESSSSGSAVASSAYIEAKAKEALLYDASGCLIPPTTKTKCKCDGTITHNENAKQVKVLSSSDHIRRVAINSKCFKTASELLK